MGKYRPIFNIGRYRYANPTDDATLENHRFSIPPYHAYGIFWMSLLTIANIFMFLPTTSSYYILALLKLAHS